MEPPKPLAKYWYTQFIYGRLRYGKTKVLKNVQALISSPIGLMFTLKHSCPVATDIGDMGEAIVMEYIVFRELSWLEEAAATLQNRIIVMKKWRYIQIDRQMPGYSEFQADCDAKVMLKQKKRQILY